jgi:hypothetical protein
MAGAPAKWMVQKAGAPIEIFRKTLTPKVTHSTFGVIFYYPSVEKFRYNDD